MQEPNARLQAMAEVLQIMTGTSFELHAVLEAVVERASRLCRAQSGFIYRLDGDRYRMDVALNVSAEFLAFTETHPIMVGNRGTLTARVVRNGERFKSPMSWPTPSTRTGKRNELDDSAPCSGYLSCAETCCWA